MSRAFVRSHRLKTSLSGTLASHILKNVAQIEEQQRQRPANRHARKGQSPLPTQREIIKRKAKPSPSKLINKQEDESKMEEYPQQRSFWSPKNLRRPRGFFRGRSKLKFGKYYQETSDKESSAPESRKKTQRFSLMKRKRQSSEEYRASSAPRQRKGSTLASKSRSPSPLGLTKRGFARLSKEQTRRESIQEFLELKKQYSKLEPFHGRR